MTALVRALAAGLLVSTVFVVAGCSIGRSSRAVVEGDATARAPGLSAPGRAAPASSGAPPTVPGPVAGPAAVPRALRGPTVPVWHIGDWWAFRWESAEGHGEYVWTIDRIESVDRVEQYVVRSGPREIHFRASDLAVSLETLGRRPERRHSPARLGFSWPLATGTTWRQRYLEERDGGASEERSIEWTVEGEDEVRVEAGTFTAIKIVARHYPTPDVMYEMWYAPRVKQWIRLTEHFPSGIRYREMIAFDLR